MPRDITVEVWYDHDAEQPPDEVFRISSFGRRHCNYTHPEKWFDEARRPVNIGVRRRIACGTLFPLCYYEHGSCVWSLAGEGPRDRFDSVPLAGVLEIVGDGPRLFKTREMREKAARAFLDEYTRWCNGEVYYIVVSDTDTEDTIDSLGNVYDIDTALADMLGADWRQNYNVTDTLGDAGWSL